MRRWLIIPVLLSLGLAACSGGTDPATNVTNLSATLNAHGHTTGVAATWWWEYSTNKADLGTENDTEVCGQEADNRCGPGTSSSDVPLHVSVTGLRPDTTYWFRACGQDEGGPVACGAALSFKTLAGTEYTYDHDVRGTGYGVDTDADANLYSAAGLGNVVSKFTPDGAFIRDWNHDFDRPADVAVDSKGNVYVMDFGNNRVQKFNVRGEFIRQWGSFGSANGQFNNAIALATDADGFVYVADTGNYRVQKFTSTGSFIRAWGSPGSGPGQFDSNQGIAVDATGNVYVSDVVLDRIQRFSVTGTYLGAWSSPGPNGIATDSAGYVYVINRPQVQKFTSTGELVATFGPDAGSTKLDDPVGLAVDKFGSVYVADFFRPGIAKFAPTR